MHKKALNTSHFTSTSNYRSLAQARDLHKLKKDSFRGSLNLQDFQAAKVSRASIASRMAKEIKEDNENLMFRTKFESYFNPDIENISNKLEKIKVDWNKIRKKTRSISSNKNSHSNNSENQEDEKITQNENMNEDEKATNNQIQKINEYILQLQLTPNVKKQHFSNQPLMFPSIPELKNCEESEENQKNKIPKDTTPISYKKTNSSLRKGSYEAGKKEITEELVEYEEELLDQQMRNILEENENLTNNFNLFQEEKEGKEEKFGLSSPIELSNNLDNKNLTSSLPLYTKDLTDIKYMNNSKDAKDLLDQKELNEIQNLRESNELIYKEGKKESNEIIDTKSLNEPKQNPVINKSEIKNKIEKSGRKSVILDYNFENDGLSLNQERNIFNLKEIRSSMKDIKGGNYIKNKMNSQFNFTVKSFSKPLDNFKSSVESKDLKTPNNSKIGRTNESILNRNIQNKHE